MKVIALSYDRKMFDRTSAEFDRMQRCAEAVDSLDIIVFTRSTEPYVTMPVSSRFTVHATASRFKITALFKAIQLGWRIAKVRKNIDVVTAQDPFETALVSWCIARRINARFNVQEHGDVFSTHHWRRESLLNLIRYVVGAWFLHRADTVRVVSQRSVATMRKLLGPHKDIRLLAVSVDVSQQRKQAVPRSLHDSFTFITAARFVPQKNLAMLLNAFATVHKKQPHTHLRIFGTGPEEIQLKTLAHQLFGTLDCPVTFTSWTDTVSAELARADVYVLSSNYEGWARVLIEALVAQLPIVTTDVGCVGEVVVNHEHALVVPVGDEAALAAALERIATDTELYARLKSTIAALDLTTIPGAQLEQYGRLWRATLQ